MTPAYWRSLLLMLLVAAAVLAAGMGLRDPWPADEPRFALIARDMALSGNWLIPYIGGVPYPDKPPVFFWLIGLAYLLTGSLRVAFLLPGLPNSPFDQFMALPYHLYTVAAHVPGMPKSTVWGVAFVLLAAVLSFNVLATIIRLKTRQRRISV